ncbi:MAG: hypothetical protein ORN98_04550 [Alphaproteobacteria bacterium]|nr:hypothetical protein [Alphaproteobacteria bacterium]
MGTIIDLSEYRRLSLAKSGQGRNHHVEHLENLTERHPSKPTQSRAHNKQNISGQSLKDGAGNTPPAFDGKSSKKSLRMNSGRLNEVGSSGGVVAATKSQKTENRLAHGQMTGLLSAQKSGQNLHPPSAKTDQTGFKKSKIIDQQAGESLLAILYYAESEAKRLGIPEAATFIACAHEILRDYNLDVENPSQTNLKG